MTSDELTEFFNKLMKFCLNFRNVNSKVEFSVAFPLKNESTTLFKCLYGVHRSSGVPGTVSNKRTL